MPKTSWRHLAVFAVLSLVSLVACSSARHGEMSEAPNFELKDLSGKSITLDSYRGRPVLLDFWATWCGPCRMSIPLVQEFYSRHKDERFVVLGLNMDDDLSGVFSFVKKYKMTYPVLFAANSSAPGDYQIEGLPHFVFVDPRGRVLQIYQGFYPDIAKQWEENLKLALTPSP